MVKTEQDSTAMSSYLKEIYRLTLLKEKVDKIKSILDKLARDEILSN